MKLDRKNATELEKWDLTGIYQSEEAFSADMESLKRELAGFPSLREKMTQSGEGLFCVLSTHTALLRKLSKLYEYAFLSSDLDKGDNGALARLDRVMNLDNDFSAATYFIDPTLCSLSDEALEGFYRDFPALTEYRRPIFRVRRYTPHMLDEGGEKLLADLSPALHKEQGVHSVFSNADLQFGTVKDENGEKVTLSSATYVPLLMSKSRAVRRSAFKTLYKTYRQFGNTFSALLGGAIKERTTLAKLRAFPDSLTASTFSDEVTPAVYNTLIETVEENLAPLFDYYALKREVLGVGKLHMYDVYAPLLPDFSEEYSYKRAVEEVLDAVRVLGEEYYTTLKRGLTEERWVDVYPTKGKRSGAYSAGCYDTSPYILLNFMGKLDDASTLAHEAGHSMHTYFSNKANPPHSAQYTIFVAEVASTVNELLFTRKKLRESTVREEKLSLLNQLMETYKGTLYRQTMFAAFEKELHALCEAGEPLTKDAMCEKYYALVKKYFGRDVVCDEDIAYEWMRIPHFYSIFYVYKYATCISAASAIVKRIEAEGEAYIPQYIEFLKAGNAKSPMDSLRLAGIDLTEKAPIEAAIADFAAAVREFRALWSEKS